MKSQIPLPLPQFYNQKIFVRMKTKTSLMKILKPSTYFILELLVNKYLA